MYGCEIPARWAIFSVELPAYPWAATSATAASSTASRRFAAVSLVVGAVISGSAF
jgi:hypothetical protein